MRKLASIQKVANVVVHPNADSLEILQILGWRVCAKKGEFKIGDLVVYCEVDSVLPDKPEFEFLRNKQFRIKTIRLRGEYSYGIVFPINIVPVGEYTEGQDVTELIGVTKYEPPCLLNINGDQKGLFPSFIRKTDECRIQAVPQILERYKDELFYVSEKCDGSSVTQYFCNGEFGVCSRNFEQRESDSALWVVARKLDLKAKLSAIGRNIAIQGELLGPKIQGNKYKFTDHKFLCFTVWDVDNQKRLDVYDAVKFCNDLGVEFVPIVMDNFKLPDNVDNLVNMANGKSALNSSVLREGLVIRPYRSIQDHDVGELSFKVISPEFLIKHNE